MPSLDTTIGILTIVVPVVGGCVAWGWRQFAGLGNVESRHYKELCEPDAVPRDPVHGKERHD